MFPFYDDFINKYVHIKLDDDEFDNLSYLYHVLSLPDVDLEDKFNKFVFTLGLGVLHCLLVDDFGNYNKKLFDFLIKE